MPDFGECMAAEWSSPDWAGLIVLCAANNWDDVRLSDRPLAEQLTRFAPVLYVDPPLSHLAPRSNPRVRPALRRPRLRLVAPGLARLTPVVTPRPFRPAITPVTRAIVRRSIGRAIETLGADVQAVISTLLLIDVFDLAPAARHVYWCQDDTAAGAGHWGMDPRRLLAGEEQVAAAADLVLAASPLAAERWRTRGRPAQALPNGCDVDRFTNAPTAAEAAPARTGDTPVAGFVGHLNERSDLGLLEAVVDAGTQLLLVGPIADTLAGPRLERLLARPGVQAVGAQPYEDLPDWLGRMDVGLVPYRDDEFNRWSFPLKTLEYLAAGLPVVSTDLPAVRWLDCPEVTAVNGPAGFTAAVHRRAASARNPELVRARQAFARTHSWAERARALAAVLDVRPRLDSLGSSDV